MTVVESLRGKNKVIQYKDIYNDILAGNYDTGKFIEFHPSDICNFRCSFCSYKDQNSINGPGVLYPFDKLDRILSLNPKAITIVGGGEPTLYYDKKMKKNFDDLVEYFHSNSEANIGLISNGSRRISKATLSKLSWIRISVDFFDSEQYQNIKKYDLNKILENIKYFEDSVCPVIGVGFLVSSNNLDQIIKCVDYFYENHPLLNIQFRTTCSRQSCDCPSLSYAKEGVIQTRDLEPEYREAIFEIKKILEGYPPEIKNYIEKQTNLYELLEDTPEDILPDIAAKYCYTSLFRWIIRPNGLVYPCVMCAMNMTRPIGSLFINSVEKLQKSAFEFYTYKRCGSSKSCCKLGQGKQNEVFEQCFHNQNQIINSNWFI